MPGINVIIDIKGMSCDHCAAAVTRALEGVAGVESCSVSLASGQAVVHVREDRRDTALPELVGAVVGAGYEVVAARLSPPR